MENGDDRGENSKKLNIGGGIRSNFSKPYLIFIFWWGIITLILY